jgi:hypothetical protein
MPHQRRNAWSAILGDGEYERPTDSRRVLAVVAQAIASGQPVPRAHAPWIAAVLRALCSGGESLDALLGLPGAAIAASAPTAVRNERLRYVARGLEGSPWAQARTLVAIAHGTGVAPTLELQSEVEALRRDFGDRQIPGSLRQVFRIITGTGRY